MSDELAQTARTVAAQAWRFFAPDERWAGGLLADRSVPGSVASVAATGFGVACLPVAVELGFIDSPAARRRFEGVLGALERAEGRRGFFYHFLHAHTLRRAWRCELSSIDTALLVAGLLLAGAYFGGDRAEAIAEAIDWPWMTRRDGLVRHGWKPEGGGRFLRHAWSGYNEALLLYVLAAGSNTHPLPPHSYAAWLDSYGVTEFGGHRFFHCGPLFTHQFPLCFLDLRGRRDAACERFGFADYLDHARSATLAQRAYAVENPGKFAGYGARSWGLSACDSPPGVRPSYLARGVPHGPDDGTLCPWSAATSLPLVPEAVLPLVREALRRDWGAAGGCGFAATHNLSRGWMSREHLAVDMGPLLLMMSNATCGLPWELARRVPTFERGLQRCGFADPRTLGA
jgi:hypothetical protein